MWYHTGIYDYEQMNTRARSKSPTARRAQPELCRAVEDNDLELMEVLVRRGTGLEEEVLSNS